MKYDYPVNKGKDGNLELNDEIQAKLTELQEGFCKKHCKAMAVRFDIRYPESYQSSGDNKDISRMIAKLVQEYSRKGYDPAYIWVREQNTSHNPHYHCAILLNGNKTRRYRQILNSAERFWRSTINIDTTGCIDHCRKGENGMLIVTKRDGSADNYHDNFDAVHYQLSYLAKQNGKATEKDGVRNFGMSRIKRS